MFNYKGLVVVALLAILFVLYFKDSAVSSYQTYAYGTYNNPEDALKEVTKQLAIISTHFNKGTKTLGYLNEIESATSIIFKVKK